MLAALLCGAVVLGAGAATSAQERARAAGGRRLVQAAEQAPATVVAIVERVDPLDAEAFVATLVVEESLAGPLASGARARIAFEERARARAPRFAAGERALLSLVAIPGASVWARRIPDPAERAATYAIAESGDAFLRRPAGGDTTLLGHYLALSLEAREGVDGTLWLTRMVASAALPIARDALRRLDAQPGLDASLTWPATRALLAALARGSQQGLTTATADLVGRRRLVSLRPALEQAVSDAIERDGGASAPPAIHEALAALDDGLEPAHQRALARLGEPYRMVAARHGSADEVARLLRQDPAPAVRVAAAQRAGRQRAPGASGALVAALHDPSPDVRREVARALGRFGPDVIDDLVAVTYGNDLEASRAAVAALSLTGGPAAQSALEALAADHPDASVRLLAQVAIGEGLGERH